MILPSGFSIIMDDDTPTLLLTDGEKVVGEFDVKSKSWVKNIWFVKPDFVWRPVSDEKIMEITGGILPSPNEFR